MRFARLVSAAALAVALAGGAVYAQPWWWGGDDNRPMHGWGFGMGPGMMGPGMMGPGMMPMMFVMMDADGDGAVSFEEMQAVHKRMFDFVDQNKDGKVSVDEMHALWGVREDKE
jgi:hypothetical protein